MSARGGGMRGGGGGVPAGAPERPDDDLRGAKALDSELLQRLWPYVRPYRWTLLAAILIVPVSNAAHLVQPWLVQHAIDHDFARRDFSSLLTTALMFLGVVVVEYGLSYLELYLMQVTGQRAMRDLRIDTFRHLLSLDPLYFTRQPVGRLLTRLTTDVEAIQEMFAAGVVALVSDGVKLAGIAIILFSIDPKLALFAFSMVPVLLLAATVMRTVMRDIYREVRWRLARINSFLNESLNGIGVIQGFAREARTTAEFADLNARYRDSYHRVIRFDVALYALVEFAASLTMAALLWFGGLRIFDDTLTFGVLVAFIDWMQRFFTPLRDISMKYTVMQSAMAAAEKIFGLLNEQPRLVAPAPARLKAAAFEREIRLEGVSFEYLPGTPVLRDIDLTIPRGQRIALVGATGSGKTTLVKLLNRFVDPTAGRVTIDGVDLRDCDPHALRRLFAVVPQEVFLFSGSLRDNIVLGAAGSGDERLHEMLRAVRAERLIQRLTRGLDHDLAERGVNLSAGQRQMIALARALAADPKVLILDEATSNIDPESEAEIVAATEHLLAGRTAVLIAHRLSTVREADRIIVLHKGRIVEQGTHDALLAAGGVYAKLHRLQFVADGTPSLSRLAAAGSPA